ncbi:E3 ubiquitin-protein ligase PUB22-like [Wolffia australiana]
MEDAMKLFKCPISMELMQDPVTVSTGVSYERKHIERWLFTCNMRTCPATMQILDSLELTPNLTLRRLISSWANPDAQKIATLSAPTADLASLLAAVESGPFKVSSLRKLQDALTTEEEKLQVVRLRGVEVLGKVVLQILSIDGRDFTAFRACEEALAALYLLPISDDVSVSFLSKPEFITAIVVMLERGSSEARLHAIAVLQRVAEKSEDWSLLLGDHDGEFLTSLLELLSDDVMGKASVIAMDMMIKLFISSNKSSLKALEFGAVHILLELLPDSNTNRCEKLLLLLEILCQSSEGRTVFLEHDMGVAVVTKKILRVSDVATKLGLKILWLLGTLHPTHKLLDDMANYGSVRKVVVLMQFHHSVKLRAKAKEIIRMNHLKWKQHPCFPRELNDAS